MYLVLFLDQHNYGSTPHSTRAAQKRKLLTRPCCSVSTASLAAAGPLTIGGKALTSIGLKPTASLVRKSI